MSMWDDWSNWAICVWGSQRHPQGPCGCWGAVTQRPPPWLRVYSNGFMAGFLVPGNLVAVVRSVCGGARWGRVAPAQWGEWPWCPSSQGPCADLPLCPHCLGSQPHKPSAVTRLSWVHKCPVKIHGEQEDFMLVATPAQAIKSVPARGWGCGGWARRLCVSP